MGSVGSRMDGMHDWEGDVNVIVNVQKNDKAG